MGRFRRVSLLVGLVLFPALLFAQFNNNTTSPYSRFGLGDLQSNTFGRTAAMGGASLASRNALQINTSNPASYTAVDSMSFIFEFGMNGRFSDYRNDITSMSANNVNFAYMAMQFQIKNWLATSLGIMPYSDVGYDVSVSETVENTGGVYSSYYGEGSLSKAYFGLALEPVKNVSIGANLNYLFGSLTRNADIYFLGASDYYNNQKIEKIRLSDFYINLGLQATLPLKNDDHITFGAVVENKAEISGFQTNLVQKYLSSGQTTDLDTLNTETADEIEGIVNMPFTYGFGVSYVKDEKLELNADYYHQTWSKAKFFGETNPFLADLNRFALGAEWIPERKSIRSYFKRVAYRAGIKYENSYLKLNNQQINDFGISFGVGLPITRTFSTINIGAEIGKRGTKDYNLVLENYAKVNVSVNLHDWWFVKRKFD